MTPSELITLQSVMALHNAIADRDLQARIAQPCGDGPPGIPIGRIPRDARTRVGFVVPVMLQGGAEEWARLLVLNLDPARFAVTGLAVRDADHVNAATMAQFVGVVPTGIGPRAVQAILDTSEIVVDWAVDLTPYRVPAGLVVVGVSHGDGSSVYAKVATAAVERCVTHWVGVSPSAYVPADGRPVEVIPNGADLDRVTRDTRPRDVVRTELGLRPIHRAVLYCGRLATEDKRIDLVVNTVAELPSRYRLVLVGGGPETDGVLKWCWTRIPGRWHHVPWTDRPGEYMAAADVGVLMSRTESFGLVLAEYLAAGLPTVTTDVGLARMEPDAFHVVPVDASARDMAHAIMADFLDPNRQARTRRGEVRMVEHYSQSAFLDRWQCYLASIAPELPELPGVLTMARNLVAAAVAQIAAGNPVLTEAETAERLAVCEVCPKRVPETWRCGGDTGCGCFLTQKAPLATASCPYGKWPISRSHDG